MALPVSGPISQQDIQAEFGGTNPASISEYYKGGAYVSIYDTAPNVPASGVITYSDFYGAEKYYPAFRTLTFTASDTWTVPGTIESPLTLTLISGAGGSGGGEGPNAGFPGYLGHEIVGNIAAVLGDVLVISVGGAGTNGSAGGGAAGGAAGPGGSLAYTGGRGGDAGVTGASGSGGGGGGATAVTVNGTLIAVAGGGGGGGGAGSLTPGQAQGPYASSGAITGAPGEDKTGDGGGGGGGGAGQQGGLGGLTTGTDDGAFSGSDGADLIPPGGTATTTATTPRVIIQGTW
jgi:hypothetical protein